MWLEIIAGICLAWYIFITLVCTTGYLQLLQTYSSTPKKAVSTSRSLPDVPHVTVIRPCKGLEPCLYECLASTFHQDYPSTKLTVHFCVSSKKDSAYSTILQVLEDFSGRDGRVFVEDEDPLLREDGNLYTRMGPNPKIRNMSRAYREAKGDVMWIIDCNVWVGQGVCGRTVDKLYGCTSSGPARPYKFVHHLPICVDVSKNINAETAGGRLEELFLSSSHAKFYTAINAVAVAPCIVGKSNMFRRSHLNYLTSPVRLQDQSSPDPSTSTSIGTQSVGIDHFSYNICEDHLIGDLLWRNFIPDSPNIGNHALVYGDLAIQPVADMSIRAYIARRNRWLRVRKFTVPIATLVEPGTEPFLCSAYGAFAATTLPVMNSRFRIPQTWSAFLFLWLCSISVWAIVDWTVYVLLHSGRTIETSSVSDKLNLIPEFAKPFRRLSRRPFHQWLCAWLGREALAFPIWAWAFFGGTRVEWRGRRFWVGMDMRVHEIHTHDSDQNHVAVDNGAVGLVAKKRE